MSGLCRLSIDIGGAFSLRLLAYVPLLTSSSSPSLLGVECQVQRKPEAFFFLGHIHFATISLEFTFSPFEFRWHRHGDTEYHRDGTGARRSSSAEGGWDAAKTLDNERVFFLNAVGKRWRVWMREVIVLYLERLGRSGSPSGRVVSGSVSDNAGGSDCRVIQTYLCCSHAVPLSHRVHLAAMAQVEVRSFHQCRIC